MFPGVKKLLADTLTHVSTLSLPYMTSSNGCFLKIHKGLGEPFAFYFVTLYIRGLEEYSTALGIVFGDFSV